MLLEIRAEFKKYSLILKILHIIEHVYAQKIGKKTHIIFIKFL
jgi:hypothetical protein